MAIKEENFTVIKLPGMQGWNSFLDATALESQQLADVTNFSYDRGFLSPREGSTKLYDAPNGETSFLQVMTARTSDGVEYLIGVYSNKFYLRHPDTNEWIQINQTYTPTETDLYYGYTNWNAGRGDDRLYFCNGVDNFGRWDICVGVVDGAHSSGAGTVTLVDGTRFPSGGGTLILKSSGGTFFTEAYTSRSGNDFTLTNTLDSNIDDGSPAVADIIEKAGMSLGKHVSKHQQRLIAANYFGGETVLNVSNQGDPEDFSTGSQIGDGTTDTIADGNGEITGLHDFGQFLVVEKEDSLHSYTFRIADGLGTKLAVIQPIVSGESFGPLKQQGTVKVLNQLWYLTRTNGFMKLAPTGTGSDVTVESEILSEPIDNFIKRKTNINTVRSASNDNKIVWALSNVGASQNLIVLEYDIKQRAWTKHSGWAVEDFTVKDGDILFMDNTDGSIHKIYDGTYHDTNKPYQASVYFPRFDYGMGAQTKSESLVYVSGYMTSASEFYIDVLFNEGGQLEKQTFRINRDTDGLYFSDAITDAQGQFILGRPMLGGVTLEGIADLRVFRCYLGVRIENAFFTLQPRVYSNKAAFYGITHLGLNPTLEPSIPHDFTIEPIEV